MHRKQTDRPSGFRTRFFDVFEDRTNELFTLELRASRIKNGNSIMNKDTKTETHRNIDSNGQASTEVQLQERKYLSIWIPLIVYIAVVICMLILSGVDIGSLSA